LVLIVQEAKNSSLQENNLIFNNKSNNLEINTKNDNSSLSYTENNNESF